MANLEIVNVDTGSVILRDAVHSDGLLTFAGADTFVAGTIIARDSVSLKYVVFVKGGSTNENGIPKALLTSDISAAGAGDVAIRAMITGFLRKERLVIDADGDDTNVDATVRDQLRTYGLVALDVQELNILDNQ